MYTNQGWFYQRLFYRYVHIWWRFILFSNLHGFALLHHRTHASLIRKRNFRRVNKLIFVCFVCARSDSWFWTKRNDEYRTSHAIIWMRWAWHRQTCLVWIWCPLIFIKIWTVFWLILFLFSYLLSHRNCGEMAAHDDNDMNESASPCGQGSHSQVFTAHIHS